MRKEYDQSFSSLLKRGLSPLMSRSQIEHPQNSKTINSSQDIMLGNRRIAIKQIREKMSDVEKMIKNREREFLSPQFLRGSIGTDNPQPKSLRPSYLNVPSKTRFTKEQLRSSWNDHMLNMFQSKQQTTRNDTNIQNMTQKVYKMEPRSALLKSSKFIQLNSPTLPHSDNNKRRQELIVRKDQPSIQFRSPIKDGNDSQAISLRVSPASKFIAGTQSHNSDKIKMHINRSMEVFDMIKKDVSNKRGQQKRSGMFDKDKQLKIINGFQFGHALGKGKFGIVYLARHKETGFIAAIKRIQKGIIKEYRMAGQFAKEVRLHSSLDHPKIVRFYGFFEEKKEVYMVLEYLNGGTLFDLLNRVGILSIKETVDFLRDMIMAVEYLHQRSIAHRDIKPENIVISTEGLGKLCDFGWASVVDSVRNTYCGTLDYVSPEVLQRKDYGLSVDIWSIGILAYEMLMGKAPFYDKNRSIVKQRILNVDKAQFSYAPNLPQQAREFIEALVQKDASKRPKTSELLNFKLFSNFGTRGSRRPN